MRIKELIQEYVKDHFDHFGALAVERGKSGPRELILTIPRGPGARVRGFGAGVRGFEAGVPGFEAGV